MQIKIDEIMKQKNISMYQVSKDTGIAQSTLSKIYNNKTTRIDFDTLEKICNYLGCEPSDILKIGDSN